MAKSADDRPDPGLLTHEQLVRLVRKLERLVEAQRDENERLRRENEQLRRENERLQQQGKQQAAPFRRRERKKNPKRPGRRPGEGPFVNRTAPADDKVTRQVEVPPLETCECGGALQVVAWEEVTTTDLPIEPRPLVTRYRVPVCRCKRCGKQRRGRHPDLAPDQFGATAHRIGDRAMAAAHALHYGVGVPQRQVPAILEMLGGIHLTQGALSQDAMRRAERDLAGEYAALRKSVAKSAVAHTDDTGWRVAGDAAQMMAFVTSKVSVYQIRPQHRNEEVREVLPADYAGTAVTDRGRAYDAKELQGVKQQKCLSHVQRNIAEVLEKKTGAARDLGEDLKAELKKGQDLWRAFHQGSVSASKFRTEGKKIREAVSDLLRPRRMRDSDNDRLVRELGWHDDRGNLTRFLVDPTVPPTNNLAEREIRPAVKARKVSQCSKTWRGARAREIHLTIVRTTQRTANGSLLDTLDRKYRALKGPAPPPAPS